MMRRVGGVKLDIDRFDSLQRVRASFTRGKVCAYIVDVENQIALKIGVDLRAG